MKWDIATAFKFMSEMSCAHPLLAQEANKLSDKIFDRKVTIKDAEAFTEMARRIVWGNIQSRIDGDSARLASAFMMLGTVLADMLHEDKELK